MKTKTLYEIALPLADHIRECLAPFCQRIQTAGSLRRNAAEVGDIEMVAIPKPRLDMFGQAFPLEVDHALNIFDYSAIGTLTANGNKMKKIQLDEGLQLDLFIVTPPAQWGVQFLIRTGSAEFSKKFVTKKQYGGYLPGHMKVEGGALYENSVMVPTPEEEDVFKAIGLPYVEPNKR